MDELDENIDMDRMDSATFDTLLNEVEQKYDKDETENIEESWMIGSKIEIYSHSEQKWVDGEIIKIFQDNEGEWLVVKYKENEIIKICDIQRYCKDIKLIIDKKFDFNHNELHGYDSVDNTMTMTPATPIMSLIMPVEDPSLSRNSTEERLSTPQALINTTNGRISISSLKQQIIISDDVETPDEHGVTPASDQAMFKYFQKIDLGEMRVETDDMYGLPLELEADSLFVHNINNTVEQLKLTSGSTPLQLSIPTSSTLQHCEHDENSDDDITEEENTDEYSEYSSDDSDNDDMFCMLGMMQQMDEDMVYAENGYKKVRKICNILQGELVLVSDVKTDKLFAIKVSEKTLVEENMVINDDGDYIFTSENRLKEKEILKYLTVLNDDYIMNKYIVKYENFFESDDSYFLVVEYIKSETNLREFIDKCQEYINENKLRLEEYFSKIKYILFQIIITLNRLHSKMNCCHLELFMENIMVIN
eukprot:47665_1